MPISSTLSGIIREPKWFKSLNLWNPVSAIILCASIVRLIAQPQTQPRFFGRLFGYISI